MVTYGYSNDCCCQPNQNMNQISNLIKEATKICQGITKGATGATGATGSIGPVGSKGDPGLTAYDLAVSKGYTGTLASWLASLQGPVGPQGVKGDAGLIPVFEIGSVTIGSTPSVNIDTSSTDTHIVLNFVLPILDISASASIVELPCEISPSVDVTVTTSLI